MTLADAEFVLFTTFRRSGEAVSSPVWITGLDDGRLGFYTTGGTGKTKRLRHTARVTVQPCGRRGQVTEGTAATTATATMVHSGADYDEVIRRIRAKYGWQAKVARFLGPRALARKGLSYADTVILISLTA